MGKPCSWHEGCENPRFSKGLCLKHWRQEHGTPLPRQREPIKQKGTRIKAQTTEEAVIKAALSKVKHELRLTAVQNNEYFCQGCGKGGTDLQCSHILSVGDRKDLELEPENIQLMCPLCHVRWETKVPLEMSKLHCFDANLEYIKKKDPGAWQRLQTKIHYDEYFSEQKIRKEKTSIPTGPRPRGKVPGQEEKGRGRNPGAAEG